MFKGNSYATFNSDVTLVGNIPTLNISSDHVTVLGNPTLDVSFDLTGVEFERAVLVNSSYAVLCSLQNLL
jgi:hypothetical protein